jgi:hypothetical protein
MNRSKQAGTGKKALVVLLVVLALTFVNLAEAQQPKKGSRIAILAGQSSSSASSRVEAFRKGLIELGYIEGRRFLKSVPRITSY